MFIELLYRYDGADTACMVSPFLDVSEASYYYHAAAWGYSNGIISGTGLNLFSPEQPVTRQEMAKMISQYLKLETLVSDTEYLDKDEISYWARPYVDAVSLTGLMSGHGGYFRPLSPVTRAEAAAILSRMDLG